MGSNTMNRRHFMAAGTAAGLFSLGGCAARFGERGSYASQIMSVKAFDTATFWMDTILQQVRDQRLAPPRAAYNFAGPTVAGFIAANAVAGAYEDSFGVGAAPKGADAEVAYGVAFGTVAAEVFQSPFLFARSDFLSRFADGEAKSLGAEWGRKIGLHINKMRTYDGSGSGAIGFYFNSWPRRNDVLQWVPTPGQNYSTRPGPAFDDYGRGLFPGQGRIKPWAMRKPADFEAEPFYDPRSPEFAEDFHLIRTIGGADSKIRTPDQTEIAVFWEDGPWGVTPPGHFMQIAMQLMAMREFSFIEKARTYALMGMGQCDASIIAWHNKYKYDIARPESAIRFQAKKFNNPDSRVVVEPKWKTVINTPNFPSYTSGHSIFGAVGAKQLAYALGGDEVKFSQESPDQVIWPMLRGRTRHFTSLTQAADENGMSRIYGGIHWLRDHQQSMRSGHALADYIHANFFKARV